MQTGSSETLIGWKSGRTACLSIGPNGGSVDGYGIGCCYVTLDPETRVSINGSYLS
jgi:hypothetical protein